MEHKEKAPLIVNAELEKLCLDCGKHHDPTEASTAVARGTAKLLRQAIEGGNDPQLVTKIGDLADALDRATFGPRTTGPMTGERLARAEENKRLHEDAHDAEEAARRRANAPGQGDSLSAAAERERKAEEAKERERERLEAARRAHK